MPVYNAENYILETLQKLEKQTFKEFRLILIDDYSKDSTKEIIENFIAKTKLNILFIKNTKNQGEGRTRNVGLKYVEAEYILFLDCDDYLDEKALEILFKNIELEECDVVVCGYSRVTRKGKIKKRYTLEENIYIEKERFIPLIISKELILGIGNTLIKSKIVKNNNLLFKDYKYGADSNFIRELALYIKKIKVIKEVLFFYVINENSIMNLKFSERRLEGIKAIEDSMNLYKLVRELDENSYIKNFSFLYNLELATIYINLLNSSGNIEEKIKLKKNIRKLSIKEFLEIKTNRKYLVFLFIYFPKIFESLYKLKRKVIYICRK